MNAVDLANYYQHYEESARTFRLFKTTLREYSLRWLKQRGIRVKIQLAHSKDQPDQWFSEIFLHFAGRVATVVFSHHISGLGSPEANLICYSEDHREKFKTYLLNGNKAIDFDNDHPYDIRIEKDVGEMIIEILGMLVRSPNPDYGHIVKAES